MKTLQLKDFFEIAKTKTVKFHLESRGVNIEKQHGLSICEDKESATFLLYNTTGQLVGFQEYSYRKPKEHKKGAMGRGVVRYYTYVSPEPASKHKMLAVFGLDKMLFTERKLFIVEGIFDCIKLQNAGLNAIAVIGGTPSRQLISWVKTLQKEVYVILDSDGLGSKMKRFGGKSFITPKPYKDLGDMPQNEVDKFINTITKGD